MNIFEELITVKEHEVEWRPGCFLAKRLHSRNLSGYEKNTIVLPCVAQNCNYEEISSDETKIGSIASFDVPVFNSHTSVKKLVKMFNRNHEILGVPIVNNGIPVGLVMKAEFFTKLSKKFGFDLFYNRPVSYVMNGDFLTTDANQSIDFIAKKVLSRNFSRLYDSFIITKDNTYYGISTVHALLEKMTALKIKYTSQSNPLTGFPGNNAIKTFVEKQIKHNLDFAFVYIDLDHFKAYNDYYGFCKGDEAIKKVADLIAAVFKPSSIGYVGHIGGDDFIAIIHPEETQELCTRFIHKFDEMSPTLYADSDTENGYIETLDRKGEKCRFPLMTVSLAVAVSNEKSQFKTLQEISAVVAEVKTKAKAIQGSIFLVDQRKR